MRLKIYLSISFFIIVLVSIVLAFINFSYSQYDFLYSLDINEKYLLDAFKFSNIHHKKFTETFTQIILQLNESDLSSYDEQYLLKEDIDFEKHGPNNDDLHECTKVLDCVFDGLIKRDPVSLINQICVSYPLRPDMKYTDLNTFGQFIESKDIVSNEGTDFLIDLGTPIVNIETGQIEAVGWLDAGGWRIGIRSLDKKRYYYYAHLQKYEKDFKPGDIVNHGNILGYSGDTGYGPLGTHGKISPHLRIQIKVTYNSDTEPQSVWINPYYLLRFIKLSDTHT